MLRPLSSLHLLSYCCSRCRGVWPVRIDGFCSAASFFVDYPRGYQCPWVQRPLPLNPRTLIITTVIIKEAGSRTEVVESQLSRLSMSVGVVLCTIMYGTAREMFRVQKVWVRAQYHISAVKHFLWWQPHAAENARFFAVLRTLFALLVTVDMDASTYCSLASEITSVVFESVAWMIFLGL